ncbi:MAG: ATP-grasp domain-containing protein [Candidatus Kaiserbacteria bacterium]|nr:ATP-grasp domain-containing protein [Candidatus Kaiserbacteria bacterium]
MNAFPETFGNAPILFAHSPKWEYRRDRDDPHTARYIPARMLTSLRPGKDFIILPGNSESVREFAKFCTAILGIERRQILYTSGTNYQIATDARIELVETLSRLVPQESAILPYAPTPSTVRLAQALGLRLIGENESWLRRFGTKAVLHRSAIPEKRPRGLPHIVDPNIPTPRGYLAVDREELALAQKKLSDAGVKRMLLKPVSGSSGEGIREVVACSDLSSYLFDLGPVVLEERLEIDRVDGAMLSPSIQYIGRGLGPVSDQVMDGHSHTGNRYPSHATLEQQAALADAAGRLVDWMRPVGPGGFDAVISGGKPYIVDVNAGRCTAAHPALFFRSRYAPQALCEVWKPKPNMSVFDIWHQLRRKGLAFMPGKDEWGVFPLYWLRGMKAQLIALGGSAEEMRVLREGTEALL